MPETDVKPVVDAKTEEKKAPTVSDIAPSNDNDGEGVQPTPETKKDETVPLAKYLELKNENKEFAKALKELEKKVAKGDSSGDEITDDLDALAEEFDVDPKFVKKLSKIFEAKAEKKTSDIVTPLLENNKNLSKAQQERKYDEAFKEEFAKTLERMPEYAEIANAGVIKALSLVRDSKGALVNKDKSFDDLVTETYEKALTGKRTIEHKNQPAGGKEPAPLDFDRARKDGEYFNEVMADPELKAEYNANMLKNNRRK